MTITEAIRRTRREVSLDRIGGSWQVSKYDRLSGYWFNYTATDWSRARREYRNTRIGHALELLGVPPDEAQNIARHADDGAFDYVMRLAYRRWKAKPRMIEEAFMGDGKY